MYVSVLQKYIFAILIFNSKGFPQDDNVLSDDENALTNDISLKDIPPKITNDDPPEEALTENTASSKATKLYDENLESDYEASEIDRSINFEPDYGDDKPFMFQLPRSAEMLDRNNPEPGFDLTFDEMKKLKLWPDGLIPYYIDVHSFSDKVLRDKIRSFLSSVNSLTSLNFVELPSPPVDNSRWVLFINRRGLLGCADHSIKNFTNTGVQHVILGYHCMSTEGELAEAVLAIAGVPPQHNAPDRDYYIKVNFGDIMPEKKFLFLKNSDDEWLFHDVEYDFKSAGHFHSYKHSVNGRATIEPQKKLKDVSLGESKALTATDILKIRMLYNYNVKKKLLQAPDCYKLFEPGKMFGKYKHTEKILKPRPKPYKYTGEAPDASLENDKDVTTSANVEMDMPDVIITVKPTEFEQPPNKDEDYSPNEQPNYDSEKEKNNDQDETPASGSNYDYVDQKPNQPEAGEEPDESENLSPSDFHADDAGAGKKPVIVSIGKGDIQPLNKKYPAQTLKSPIKVQEDLLSYLSDYHSDDEKKKKYRKKHSLHQTLQI